MSEPGIYSLLAPLYDRLFPVGETQAEFLRARLRAEGAASVLDAGCGTGRHLEIFARAGLALAGVEPEAAMAEAARARLASLGAEAEMAVCPLEEAAAHLVGPYDAAVCLGNTLAHLVEPATLAAGIAALAVLVAPGGILITQTVNFDLALRERRGPFTERRITDPERGELVFRRSYGFDDAPARLDFRLELSGEGLGLRESVPLRPLTESEQTAALAAGGFEVEERLGDWDGRALDADSPAILLVSRRTPA